AGFAVPFCHVPFAIIWGVNVSATSVTLSPFLIVTDDWTKLVSFIWTVFPGALVPDPPMAQPTSRRVMTPHSTSRADHFLAMAFPRVISLFEAHLPGVQPLEWLPA